MVAVDVPMLRTSERSSFKTCRWAWDKAYVRRIKPAIEKPALRFGTLIHESLRVYYKKGTKRGRHPASVFGELYAAQLVELEGIGFKEDDQWVDAATLGEAMLNGYVDRYGADDRWSVLAVEHPFQVPVMHPRTGKLWFYYTGVIDLCVRDREDGFIGLVDHKTTSSNPMSFVTQLSLDEQAGAYWRYGSEALYSSGLLRQDKELNGLIFNFLQKKLPDTRKQNAEGHYLNKDGTVSKAQPPPLFYRTKTWRTHAEGERVHARVLEEMREMQLTRRGKMVAYKNPGPLYKPNCAGCGYRDVCELHESGADYESVVKATMAEWDPYAEHERFER